MHKNFDGSQKQRRAYYIVGFFYAKTLKINSLMIVTQVASLCKNLYYFCRNLILIWES